MSGTPTFLVVCREKGDEQPFPDLLESMNCCCQISYRDANYDPVTFDPAAHTGLIVLGDDILDPGNPIQCATEIAWIKAAIQYGLAVLGICHGAQLLASMHGGHLIKRRSYSDKGIGALKLTDTGRVDPVVQDLHLSEAAQWHRYTFAVPANAVALADSSNTDHPHCDAFRIGRNVYGLQFHPEPTADRLLNEGWQAGLTHDRACSVSRVGKSILQAWVRLALATVPHPTASS